MKIGPKYKICKRLGASVFEKCQTQKFQLAEARSPRVMRRSRSDYGTQLLEKQKARLTYGLSESQFSRYAAEAMHHKGASAEGLMNRLESRLDNVVYRAGWAPTRGAARQLVSHGHITIGTGEHKRRMTVPSYRVSSGETIAIRDESRVSPYFGNRAERAAETKTPPWLALEDGGFGAVVQSQPTLAVGEVAFDPGVIIQFYSR
ncbi:MAG: 30S ribosomal protein S4 [Minisyncoccia bacterium]